MIDNYGQYNIRALGKPFREGDIGIGEIEYIVGE